LAVLKFFKNREIFNFLKSTKGVFSNYACRIYTKTRCIQQYIWQALWQTDGRTDKRATACR